MKNKLTLTFIFIIFIAVNINVFGQQQLGVKVNGGISRIYGQLDSRDYPASTRSTSFSPSVLAGVYYNLKMGKNHAIGAELLFSRISGSQTVKWDYKEMGASEIYTNLSNIIEEQISYVSLPIYYGITFKRLIINGGFQFSYALASSGNDKIHYKVIMIAEEDVPITKEGGTDRELDDLDIKAIDFGPRVGAIYQLTNKLSIEGMFYHGMNNINQLNSSEKTLKIQQMTVE